MWSFVGGLVKWSKWILFINSSYVARVSNIARGSLLAALPCGRIIRNTFAILDPKNTQAKPLGQCLLREITSTLHLIIENAKKRSNYAFPLHL
jgi:hypothetical protein